jgi:oligopeptide transport system substrate-binding protein
MYEAERLDRFEYTLDPAEAKRMQHRHAEEYGVFPILLTHYMAFNCHRPPFDDPRIRKAFVLAIDREHLADMILGGRRFPATGGLVPPGMPGHVDGIALPYDPEQARHLLADSGHPKGRGFPVIQFPRSDNIFGQLIYSYLDRQWSEILGVKIAGQALPWDEFMALLDEDLPNMWAMGWSPAYPDPDDYLRICDWQARCGWRHGDFERLIDDARGLMDQEKRLQMYHQAEKILVDEAPMFPLTYGRWHYLSKPWLRKYPVSALKGWYWKDAIIDPH